MKIGLFGGTFDPVHNAHLFVAEAARVELGLERMIFLPTRGSHYRSGPVASIEQRMAMLRGALASNPHFAIDETDLDASATGYSADLLPRVRARYPHDDLTFVVGGDSLVDSPWQRFDVVLANLDAFAIAPRAERAPERVDSLLATLAPGDREKLRVLDLPALNGSATLVRRQLARGGSIRYLVPEFVARYIAEHGLYRATPDALAHAD
ncbi:MAG: nicotinate (nicotinamide) nucleotide adenylyltransferase [Candidatus Eremiobacteraeota bacterium]|nr:nicotinate (nicotinamide) nucleotide adenylyltransferase [Candidatus Eremiobacteraeota bacterium]